MGVGGTLQKYRQLYPTPCYSNVTGVLIESENSQKQHMRTPLCFRHFSFRSNLYCQLLRNISVRTIEMKKNILKFVPTRIGRLQKSYIHQYEMNRFKIFICNLRNIQFLYFEINHFTTNNNRLASSNHIDLLLKYPNPSFLQIASLLTIIIHPLNSPMWTKIP